MKISTLLSATTFASAVCTTFAADAAIIKDNAAGAYALANMPGTDPGNNGVFAEIVASTSSDGEGVEMTINLNGGTPRAGGPFLYHVHEKAVPSSGDCQATGAHLDPTGRGENPGCDANKPETCQVGDLSGKHGDCGTFPGCSKSFRDKFLSLTPGNPAFIGDKSFVIHYANKTRIACVNFVISGKGGSQPGSGSSASSQAPSPSSSSGSSSGGSGSPPAGSSGAPPAPSAPRSSSSAPGPASRPSTSSSPSPSSAASSYQTAESFTAVVLALIGLVIW